MAPLLASSPLHSAATLLHGTAGGAPRLLPLLRSGATPRRVAVVMVVAVPAGGCTVPFARRQRYYAYTGDQVSPAGTYEVFERHMKRFCDKYDATTLLKEHDVIVLLKEHDEELKATSITAKKCFSLVETILKDGASEYSEEEIFPIGESFMEVVIQCDKGYARAKSIEDAMDGLKRMVDIFAIGGGDTGGLTRYPGPSRFADRNAYLQELVNRFQTLSSEVETMYMQDRRHGSL